RNSALAFVFSLLGTVVILFLSFGFRRLSQRSVGCCCEAARTLRRLPISDSATPPLFSRSQRSLSSSPFPHHRHPASIPSGADHSRPRTVPECAALPAPAACADTDRLPC